MKTVRFLHISDLHRGGDWNSDTVGDHKDSSVSKAFAGAITSSMESDFVDAIKQWQYSHGIIDAIVCTGDLGNRGDSSKIEEGVSYIQWIQKELGIADNNVLFCPGNHDADRNRDIDHAFSGYCDALKKYSFTDHLQDSTPVKINGIPFLILNTSLGASEKSLFIQKYKELADSLDEKDKKRFNSELKAAGVEYLEDCLDIPAITNSQRERIIRAITSDQSSFVVLVMHHGLLPSNMVEIRPYSSVLDAGKTLEELINTQKDILIVHGHVHFPSTYMISHPGGYSFISSVSTGIFNGSSGSTINIIELFCSDDGEHIITVVYEYIKQANGLHFNKPTYIFDRKGKDYLSEVLAVFKRNPGTGIELGVIKTQVGCSEIELLSTVLLNDTVFKISRNKSTNPSDWVIHRNS